MNDIKNQTKNFKEWVGKTLLVRLMNENIKYNKLKAKYEQLELLCGQDSHVTDRVNLLSFIDRGFKVFEGETITLIESAVVDIWLSVSFVLTPQITYKKYHFKIVNNERVLHGQYVIEINTDFIRATWHDGKFISSKRVGDKQLRDNINRAEPFYSGCEIKQLKFGL